MKLFFAVLVIIRKRGEPKYPFFVGDYLYILKCIHLQEHNGPLLHVAEQRLAHVFCPEWIVNTLGFRVYTVFIPLLNSALETQKQLYMFQ